MISPFVFFFNLIKAYYRLKFKLTLIFLALLKPWLIQRWEFLRKFYLRNENIYVDGFLIDFLQKKTIDNWVRGYVIYTGFLFSERLFFDSIVRVYNDLYMWFLHDITIIEPRNISATLNTILYTYFLIFISLLIIYSLVL